MLSPDMRVMLEVFKELAPQVNAPEIIGAAIRTAEKIKGTTVNVKEYISALMNMAAEEAAENM